MVHQEQITVQTLGHGHMQDLTSEVLRIVKASGIGTGIANVAHLGSTAALCLIEFEPGLQRDLPEMLDRLMPPSLEYGHEQTWHDGNGHSHLQATTLGQTLTMPVSAQKLLLGQWQQIVLLECDIHVRERKVAVTVMGE